MMLKWWTARARPGPIGEVSPGLKVLLRSILCPLIRIGHRPRIDGLEHLPPVQAAPYLLVANHSGAMAVSEILSLACLWLRKLGSRRIAPLTHPFGFVLPPINLLVRRLGAIPSSMEQAAKALGEGFPLLIFPGGAHEASRPFWQANRVDFGGHKGFLRLAHQAWTPIVPMRIFGSHLTAPVLWRSHLLGWLLVLPRLLGVKQYPVTLLGAAGAAGLALMLTPAYGWLWTTLAIGVWLATPFVFWPIVPLSIRFVVLSPIAPEELFRSCETLDEEELAGALALVEDRLRQAEVTRS